jgi:hypothetical protein
VLVVEHGPSCAHIENARQRLQRPGHEPAVNGQAASQEEAPDELDARLRELAQDAWAAYFRDRTEAPGQVLAQGMGDTGSTASEAELEEAVSTVLTTRNFKRQVAECQTGEQHVLKLARAVFRGLGMTADEAKNLARKTQWEAWLREQDAI